jgi:hypothetical protein
VLRFPTRLALCFILAACSNPANVEVVHEPDGGGDATTDGAADSGHGDDAGDAEPEDAADEALPDAPLSRVSLGVIPAGPDPDVMAHLETLAAGSRGVSVIRRWSDLYSTLQDPRPEAWAELEQIAPLYAQADRTLLLSISVVDRLVDARPAGADPGWYALANRQAMEALIDRVWTTFGDELGYLVIGEDVDRWMPGQDASDRSAFVEFVRSSLDYARRHPSRPDGVQVGVAASLRGWVAGSSDLDTLRAASDVVVATYYPVDERWNAAPPTSAGPDLDDLLGVLGADAGPATVVLQEVGYPSADQSGSSAQQQQQFYESLFGALRARRDQLPFVSLFALDDPDPAACAEAAVAFGLPGDTRVVAGFCSLGLRDHDGIPKPAWTTVSGALADFALP